MSNPIKDLGVFYATSRNILEDEPMMENILQVRVGERMSRRLDNAFLNQATGTNNFTGILQLTGFPTFSKDVGDSLQVAITRAIEAINGPAVTGITGSGGQAMADAIYVTVPVYWDFMRQQDALGNFMVSMGLREAPQLRVAGIPVMQCQALPAGNILVMDRMYTHIRGPAGGGNILDGADGCSQHSHSAHSPTDGGSGCAGHDLGAPPQRQLPYHWGLTHGRASEGAMPRISNSNQIEGATLFEFETSVRLTGCPGSWAQRDGSDPRRSPRRRLCSCADLSPCPDGRNDCIRVSRRW